MASFTLALLPNGKAILTCKQPLTRDAAENYRRIWEEWRAADSDKVLMIGDAEVVTITEIELEDFMAKKTDKDLVDQVKVDRPAVVAKSEKQPVEDIKSVKGVAEPTKRG